MIRCFLDFETYSENPLTDGPLYEYVRHPSTEVLLCGLVFDDYPGEVIEGYNAIWTRISQLVADPRIRFYSFNLEFEFEVIREVLKIPVSYDRGSCVMLHAWTLGFAGGLAEVGEQLDIPQNWAKDRKGKALVQRFSSPTPAHHKIRRYTKITHPEQWEEFKEYCKQDAYACQWIQRQLDAWPIRDTFAQEWEIDRRINTRGLPIDMELCQAALEMHESTAAILINRLKDLTGLSNPNSRDQLLGWLNAQGLDMPDLTKESVTLYLDTLKSTWGEDNLIEVLELRRQLNRTSISKYSAIVRAVSKDGRLRGTIQTVGAQRTQRYAGRIFQPHNLPKAIVDSDLAARIVLTRDPAWLAVVYGNRSGDVLSSAIRAVVAAPEGRLLVVQDYGSIESRILGWVTGCQRINDCFTNNRDTYKDFAAEAYRVPYDEVTKEQRNFSKPPVLGCFAGETLVLSDRGWMRIDRITEEKLWDGKEWVCHGGLVERGRQTTITRLGVRATAPHRIYCGTVRGWRSWGLLKDSDLKLALISASLSNLALIPAEPADGEVVQNGIRPAMKNGRLPGPGIEHETGQETVPSVPSPAYRSSLSETALEPGLSLREKAPRSGCAGAIAETLPGSPIVHYDSDTAEPVDVAPSKHVNETENVKTYDIYNAGPRHRFTVLTDEGPILVHNCGYMLSARGLVVYADRMGVDMTMEKSKELVGLWREINHEVTTFWYAFQDTVIRAVSFGLDIPLPQYKLRVDGSHPGMLVIWLPSGRGIYYHRPQIVLNDWGNKSLQYRGKDQVTYVWTDILTHPGKLTENIIQAIAADILKFALEYLERFLVGRTDWQTVLHVHDEIVAEADEGMAEAVKDIMTWVMSMAPAWAPGLRLSASGYIAKRYRKE